MASRRADWLLGGGLLFLTSILALQYSKQNMLPRTQTKLVWAALAVSAAGALVLRSGLMRDNRWREEQRRLGTLANNFYEPRREWLVHAFAMGFGVFGGLWWGLATWSAILVGLQKGGGERGFADFELAAVCGVVTGAVLGATVGLAIGHIWETRHRRSREARDETVASRAR